MPEITFHQGMPNDLVQSKYFDPYVASLFVFDDLMRTVMNDDDTAADLFTEGAHRTNIFPGEKNQFHPDDIFHTISPIVDSFKKKN